MFAILAEDDSDAEVLMHIIKRFLSNDRLSVKKKGYDGCGQLYRKGARDINSWLERDIKYFIVCIDADSADPILVYRNILNKIVQPAGVESQCCITIPVQEMEAWLIADEQAIKTAIPSFHFTGHPHPERINSPKEWLIDQSRRANGKPLYAPATFNAVVAKHLRFDVVASKCPSFQRFISCLSSFFPPEQVDKQSSTDNTA